MKVYVAAKWEERQIARRLMDLLEDAGHTIVGDWTGTQDKPRQECGGDAVRDITGVQKADVYVGIFLRPYKYQGAFVELGVALGLNKPAVILGHAVDDCIFVYHPNVKKVNTLEELCKQVTSYSPS